METPRALMPAALRSAIYLCFGTLWLTGCAWMVLRYGFQVSGAFGLEPHPVQGSVLLWHGIAAVPATWLLGWLMARHSAEGWRQRRRRLSGSLLVTVIALLTLSGFALFFLVDDRWTSASGMAHQVLGVAMTLFAAEHWWLKRRPRSGDRRSGP